VPSYGPGLFSNEKTRRIWIVPFTIWILWALTLLTRYFVGGSHHDAFYDNRTTDAEGVAAGATNTTGRPEKARMGGGIMSSLAHRTQRVANLLRDLLLSITLALIVNTFGGGTTKGTEVLSWVFLGFLLFWAATEFMMDHRIVRLTFGLVEYGIVLAILSLAWAEGWGW